MDDKIIGNVYETFDYGRFRILLGNRNIPSIEKISKSIDGVGSLVIPIIVNEKYEIIDGQTRFTAWKERNLPVYYIVCEGYGMRECIAMNTTSVNWRIEDYINCYAEYGHSDYVALREFENQYSYVLPKTVIRSVSGGMVAQAPTKAIKDGKFKLSKTKDEIEKVFDYLSLFDIPQSIRGNAKLIYLVLRFCYECKDIDKTKLLKQWQDYSTQIQGITDIKSAADAVEKIYNYRSKKDYVYIATEYRKAAEQKCAGRIGGGKSAWDK